MTRGTFSGSPGFAVMNQHIWWFGVGRIANPTYFWQRTTGNPNEPFFSHDHPIKLTLK